jgi:hypothetical protein
VELQIRRRRRPRGWPVTRAVALARAGEEGEHQPLPASQVHEQTFRGQYAVFENLQVHGIPSQFAAREFPR